MYLNIFLTSEQCFTNIKKKSVQNILGCLNISIFPSVQIMIFMITAVFYIAYSIAYNHDYVHNLIFPRATKSGTGI